MGASAMDAPIFYQMKGALSMSLYYHNSQLRPALNSFVPTPDPLAQWIHEITAHINPQTVCDPAIGYGNLTAPWTKDTIYGCDIMPESQKYADHFHLGKFELLPKNPFPSTPDLVLCNPPFGGGPKNMMYPELFLRCIFDRFGTSVPLVFFTPASFLARTYRRSRRWQLFGWLPPITGTLTVPADVFGNFKVEVNILIFNINGIPAHQFYPY